jgi:formamidopyrimidine-DNA glycosylase
MPELPEVQTTVDGLNRVLKGKKIVSVWSSYDSPYFKGKENIKDKKYFFKFKKNILNSPILKSERVGKNILIHLKNKITILIHMKMTGHLLYGHYHKVKNSKQIPNSKFQIPKTGEWVAIDKGPLQDPFNRHIRLVFELNNGKHLAFADMRKFAKVMFIKTKDLKTHRDLKNIAPDPFELTQKEFVEIIKGKKSGRTRPNVRRGGRVKNVLMDQTLVSGIGNIYSDETLFLTGIHPETNIDAIPDKKMTEIYREVKKVLKKGINFGGDSTSDYRNIKGERGDFQNKHQVYRKTGEKCSKKGCSGKILRKVVGGRSAHFCNKHQKKIG